MNSLLQTKSLAVQILVLLIVCISIDQGAAQEAVPSWTSNDGKTIKAEFMRLESNVLVIRKDDREFNVPLSQLSEVSRGQARSMAKTRQPANPKLTEEELASLWDKLLSRQPFATKQRLESVDALLKLAEHPESTTEFLASKLKPVKLSRKELRTLLESLGSDDETEWKQAYSRLRVCDPMLFISVKKLYDLPEVKAYPARNRLADLTHGLTLENLADESRNFMSLTYQKTKSISVVSVEGELKLKFMRRFKNGGAFEKHWNFSKEEQVTPELLRSAKALMLLASFNTKSAGRVILSMASGHPKSLLTKTARLLIKERKFPSEQLELNELWDALRPRLLYNVEQFELWDFSPRVSSQLAHFYAITRLLKNPAATTQMLSQKLRPAEMSHETFESLLEKLGSQDEAEWRDAFETLSVINRNWEISEVESLLARPQFRDYPARHRLVDLVTHTPLTSYCAASRRSGQYKSVTVAEAPDEDGSKLSIKCGPDDKFRGDSPAYWDGAAERDAMSLMILDSFSHRPAKELIEVIANGDPQAGITTFAQSLLKNNQTDDRESSE